MDDVYLDNLKVVLGRVVYMDDVRRYGYISKIKNDSICVSSFSGILDQYCYYDFNGRAGGRMKVLNLLKEIIPVGGVTHVD